MESNRAPLWNSIAMRRRMGKSCRSSRAEISVPSKKTRPASGFSRPLSSRNVTLLPEPERPRMTKVSPRAISKSSPSRITLLPYCLRNPEAMKTGSAIAPFGECLS